MKISQVRVTLTEKDLLSIVKDVFNEYVKVEGLEIDNIFINDMIIIKGSYKFGAKIPFIVKVLICEVKDNTIKAQICGVNISNIYVFEFIRNFALKIVLKNFSHMGITIDKKDIFINFNLLCKTIECVSFKLKTLKVVSYGIDVEAEEVVYSEDKEFMAKYIASNIEGIVELGEDKENIEQDVETTKQEVNKTEDCYTKVRQGVENLVPDKYQVVMKYAIIIPDIIALFWRIFKDKRVNIKTKILVASVTTYLVAPIDILPDKIPILGNIDDIAIAFFALDKIINDVPVEVIIENWAGEEDIILLVKEGIKHLYNVVGANKIDKILAFTKAGCKKK